jgi:hypothetical protein
MKSQLRLRGVDIEYAVLSKLCELGSASARDIHTHGEPQGLLYSLAAFQPANESAVPGNADWRLFGVEGPDGTPARAAGRQPRRDACATVWAAMEHFAVCIIGGRRNLW